MSVALADRTPEEIFALRDALIFEADALYARDPWLWMSEQVFTVDEATQKKLAWPEKPYLRELCELVESEQMIAIPKSRRMMVSWFFAAWVLHRIRYFAHNAVFWQSENEQKAAYVLDKRCKYIEDNLREKEFRRAYTPHHTSKGAVGRLTFHKTRSYAWAVPEGDAVLRTYTPSILVMDEIEFQQEAHAALEAAIPFAEKGAKLILISSSNGPRGVLAAICKEVGFVRWS